ncbi:MAG: ATP-binding cassette domain-containing protein [Desulfobacteraceae bacterium]|jgi:ABC-type multidrug transport system ATPase subunit|nr:ATP-binding cassette domain-containing protein [Desulfobacteraceae bacterium]
MQISCDDIALSLAGAETPVFAALSFTLKGPGFHALFGPSGIGKTTLARLLIGHVRPDAGRVGIDGCPRRLYAYNLERLPGWSSVGRHLEKITPARHRARCAELAVEFGIAPVLGQRFARLSLGQKNRVNLIRYLVQDFDLLIMDESLANVDERTREQIIAKIKTLFPDRFFLYISHNVIEVARFCQQVLVLRGAHRRPQAVTVPGLDGAAREAATSPALEKAMLAIMNAV